MFGWERFTLILSARAYNKRGAAGSLARVPDRLNRLLTGYPRLFCVDCVYRGLESLEYDAGPRRRWMGGFRR